MTRGDKQVKVLLCYIIGHFWTYKYDLRRENVDALTYKEMWRVGQHKYCLRCGEKNPNYMEAVSK